MSKLYKLKRKVYIPKKIWVSVKYIKDDYDYLDVEWEEIKWVTKLIAYKKILTKKEK